MQKILVIVAIVIYSFLCVGIVEAAEVREGFSYADGWLDRNKGKYTVSTNLEAAIDNDLTTVTKLKRKETGEIFINEGVEVDYLAFYINSAVPSFESLTITFYKNDVIVYSKKLQVDKYAVYMNIDPPVNFDRISLQNTGTTTFGIVDLYEFEIFDKDSVAMPEFAEIKAEYENVDIEVKMPTGAKSVSLYMDGKFIGTSTNGKYKINDLKSDTTYKLGVLATFENSISRQVETSFKTKTIPEIKKEIIAVNGITQNSAKVNFLLSKVNVLPKKIVLKNNGSEVSSLGVSNNQDTYILISNLKNETNYNYDVEFIYKDDTVRKTEVSFKTNAAQKEVNNLTAVATAEDVSLKWEMPKYDGLDFARIYRQKQKDDEGLIARTFSFFSSDTYEPLFETNGTTFKDLTVKADTEYQYKVTTVDKYKNETTGMTVSIKTKKMSVTGGGTEKDENGDYVITWTSPTKGKIKVLIGGEEYAVVSASDKKIVIPKDKMKFDLIGLPDVQLIPIDEAGNEGTPSKPGGGTGGGIGDVVGGETVGKIINTENLLGAVMALLLLISGFVLLALAFDLVPKLVKMIRNAFKSNRKDVNVYTRRRIEE